MADEITIRRKSGLESTPASSLLETQTSHLWRTELISLCAVGLGVSFFLPWVNFLGADLSGFDLQKTGDEQRLLWLIPLACALTIIFGVKKTSQRIIGEITCALPFLVGFYWYYKLGSDLFHILAYGAYLSLLFSAAMSVLLKKAK